MEIFLTSIQSIVPIIVIIILGYFLQVRGWFQESFGNDLSKLIMNVAMPVAIFTSVLKYLTLDKLISGKKGIDICFLIYGANANLNTVKQFEKYVSEQYGLYCEIRSGDQKVYDYYIGLQ